MISSSFDQIKIQFEKLLAWVARILTTEHERTAIENKLRRHFNTASSEYLCSDDFSSLLHQTSQIFEKKSPCAKYFTQLVAFDEQLKKNSIKVSKSNPAVSPSINDQTIITSTLPSPNSDTTDDDLAFVVVQEVIDYLLDQCESIVSESAAMTADEVREEKRQRRIAKLEGKLSRLSRLIRKLEETEMSLDDMAHGDLYQVEANLKKQASDIYTALAQLKSQPTSAERILCQPIIVPALDTAHPLVHEELQKMVNQWKYFPSFDDVLTIVEQSNEKHQLNISQDALNTLAEKFFKLIGKEMKTRRMADFHQVMSSRLPEDFDIEQNDPAVGNIEIETILSNNERDAAIRTERVTANKILEEFSLIEPDPDAATSVEELESEAEPTNEVDNDAANCLSTPCEKDNLSEVHLARRSSIAPEPIVDAAPSSDPSDTVVEVLSSDNSLVEVSTASAEVQAVEEDHLIENDCPLLHPESMKGTGPKLEMTTPRHSEQPPKNQILYTLYRQRLTNGASPMTRKRPLSERSDTSTAKKSKQHEPDIIVLD